jgi:hypothetical protein
MSLINMAIGVSDSSSGRLLLLRSEFQSDGNLSTNAIENDIFSDQRHILKVVTMPLTGFNALIYMRI